MVARESSFVRVSPDSHFPIQNLPYGVFRPRHGGAARVGVAIGEFVLDLGALEAIGFFDEISPARQTFSAGSLNAFLSLGRPAWQKARGRIQNLLDAGEPTLRDDSDLRSRVLYARRDVDLLLPAEIGDFTDFYSSREHATNVGTLFRGRENALMPNWLHLPVAYHGRSSSVVVSGTDVRRPRGQIRVGDGPPALGPTKQLDFELEVGFFVGPGTSPGERIPIERASEHIFGFVLVNDWSARDIQSWEYVPLGPFLGKNFATTISPWVVPIEALEPFRCDGPIQDPPPLPYLRSEGPWAFDVELEVAIQGAMADHPTIVTHTNLRTLYWNVCQQLAHHTVNGCNVRPGDLMASGTISGPTRESSGSLLELTWRGEYPVVLSDSSTRAFLEDGDRVVLTGRARSQDYTVGFGEAAARIVP
jgi:fumarylacetoacetase